jgi:hypothetical protein
VYFFKPLCKLGKSAHPSLALFSSRCSARGLVGDCVCIRPFSQGFSFLSALLGISNHEVITFETSVNGRDVGRCVLNRGNPIRQVRRLTINKAHPASQSGSPSIDHYPTIIHMILMDLHEGNNGIHKSSDIDTDHQQEHIAIR